MPAYFLRKPAAWGAALCLTMGLSGCGQGSSPAAPGAAVPAEVGVLRVQPQAVPLVSELPGRLEASRVAQVRARAAGILTERLFREGATVRPGQVLFHIDDAPYEAALAAAKASLAKAQANLTQATAQAERYKPLAAAKAISEQEWVAAQATHQQALADVAAAKAAVQTADINLGHTRVVAPIGGRIGRELVTVGALVGQGETTPLALIQQTHPMYINFTQSAADVLKMRRALERGQLKRVSGEQAASVRLLLEDGSVYPRPAKLLFSDLSVDPTSGQITLRAEVPNPDDALLPGLYVRVQLEQSLAPDAVLLPQQALTRSAQGDTVMVVGADGKVTPRRVKVGAQQNGQWVVLEGLQAGEQVMVDGFQKLRGDAPVKPVPWKAPAASAPASAPVSR